MADEPAPVPSPEPVPAPEPVARPEWAPEAFWDATTGAVKTEDLAKSWAEAQAKLNPSEPTAEEKAALEKTKGEEAVAAQAALRDAYELKAPEGFELADEQLTPVKELFAKLGVPKDGAQELIDLYASNASALATQIEGANAKAWTDLHTEWQGTIDKDPVYGGAKLPETKASIVKVMDQFGSPELKAAFDLTGADKHPAVFKFLAKLSGALNEGQFINGKPANAEPKDLAERLYPNGGNKNFRGVAPAGET
jgi:hypothetical protein